MWHWWILRFERKYSHNFTCPLCGAFLSRPETWMEFENEWWIGGRKRGWWWWWWKISELIKLKNAPFLRKYQTTNTLKYSHQLKLERTRLDCWNSIANRSICTSTAYLVCPRSTVTSASSTRRTRPAPVRRPSDWAAPCPRWRTGPRSNQAEVSIFLELKTITTNTPAAPDHWPANDNH